jgi:hypothetical protein
MKALITILLIAFTMSVFTQEIEIKSLDDKQGVFYKRGTDDKYSGVVVRYHSDSKVLEYRFQMKDGKFNGTAETWFENGKKDSVGFFKDGLKHGKWESFFGNGKKRTLCNYENGKVIGKAEAWDKEGNVDSDLAKEVAFNERQSRYLSAGELRKLLYKSREFKSAKGKALMVLDDLLAFDPKIKTLLSPATNKKYILFCEEFNLGDSFSKWLADHSAIWGYEGIADKDNMRVVIFTDDTILQIPEEKFKVILSDEVNKYLHPEKFTAKLKQFKDELDKKILLWREEKKANLSDMSKNDNKATDHIQFIQDKISHYNDTTGNNIESLVMLQKIYPDIKSLISPVTNKEYIYFPEKYLNGKSPSDWYFDNDAISVYDAESKDGRRLVTSPMSLAQFLPEKVFQERLARTIKKYTK